MATRLAICGIGKQGMDHIDACLRNRNIRIVALVDRCHGQQKRGWKKINAKYPEIPPRSYNRLYEMVADDSMKRNLEGVILALPHHVYWEEWDYIMRLDVPILKEKPLGRNLLEANRFLNDAQGRGIALMTAVQRRYHPAYRALRKLISQQRVVRSIRIIYCLGKNKPSKFGDWRQDIRKSGGAMLLDAGYHMMDLVQFLVGMGHLVSATLTKDRNGREIPCGREDLEDHCYLTICKASMLISIECHLSGEPTERVIVDVVDSRDKGGVIDLERGRKEFELRRSGYNSRKFNRDWDGSLGGQIDEFVKHIREGSIDFQRLAYSQLPVQRMIHDAYALADPFSSTLGIQRLLTDEGTRE